MSYRSHNFSSVKPRGAHFARHYLWRLLWVLPFLWTSTLGEVLHHYVELPAQYHCAAEEIQGATIDVGNSDAAVTDAKVRSHACHGHHSHNADNCIACRYISRLASPSISVEPVLVSRIVSPGSIEQKVFSVTHCGRPVRGPPLLTI